MPPNEKLDLYKVLKNEYVTPKAPALIQTTKGKYLTFCGQGEPGGEAFQNGIQALYNVAFTIKMRKKFEEGVDYKVCTLEGLYELGENPPEDRTLWKWTLMIRVPDYIGANDLKRAAKQLLDKGKPESVLGVKLQSIKEGRCVQMLHVGPYDAECATFAKMKEFVDSQGLHLTGLHHESYLSDPRRVPPERLRTILRHPVSA